MLTGAPLSVDSEAGPTVRRMRENTLPNDAQLHLLTSQGIHFPRTQILLPMRTISFWEIVVNVFVLFSDEQHSSFQ